MISNQLLLHFFQLQWAMTPCVVPLPKLQPRCCSGWASLTRRSSLQPVHGSFPLWESCSSTSRFAAEHFLVKFKTFKYYLVAVVEDWCWFQLARVQHPALHDVVRYIQYIVYSWVVILLSVSLGYRAGQGGCEAGPCSTEPTPKHPHLPGGGESHSCWHHCVLLHALAVQTGLTCAHTPTTVIQSNTPLSS